VIGILFPAASAYRPGIGRELHENFDGLGPFAAEYAATTGSSLAADVWYGPEQAPEPAVADRAAAVLAVSCGFHAVFSTAFPLPSAPVLVGSGTGLVAALLCADAIDRADAFAIVRGARPEQSWFRAGRTDVATLEDGAVLREPAQMLAAVRAIGDARSAHREPTEVLAELGVDVAVEIGPGDPLRQQFLAAEGGDVDIVTGSLDSGVNAQTFLDTVAVRKFFNVRFLAERALGQLVGTRNRNGGVESEQAVLDLGKRLRRMVLEDELPTDAESASSGRWDDAIAAIVAIWTENGRVKGYAPGEITESLRALERITLLPVRAIADLGDDRSGTHRRGAEILAH
jgi:hypothetical protein